MEDVSSLISGNLPSPKEAVTNIEGAKEYGVNPDGFAEIKPSLLKVVGREPAQAAEPIAKEMRKSKQHASIISDSLEALNNLFSVGSYLRDIKKNRDISRDLNNLQYRKMNGEKLESYERRQIRKLEKQEREYALKKDGAIVSQLPEEVAGMVYDTAAGLWDNKETALAITALGATATATTGALGGFLAGNLPGAVIGGVGGAISGAASTIPLGLEVTFIQDMYKQSTGRLYYELGKTDAYKSDDPNIQKKYDADRAFVAKTAGGVIGLIGAISTRALLNKSPWLKKYTDPKAFARLVSTNQFQRVMQLGKRLQASAVIGGAQGGLVEFINEFTTNLGKTYDGSETSFFEAIEDTLSYKKGLGKTAKRVGTGTVTGAAGAATFTGGLDLLGRFIGGEPGQPKIIDVEYTESTRTSVENVANNLFNPKLPSAVKGTKAIQVKHVLDMALEITKNSSIEQVAPNQMAEIRRGIFNSVGVKEMYVDKDVLNEWANTEEKANRVREILTKGGAKDSDINAVVRFKMDEIFRLGEEFPDFTDIVKDAPENPSYREYLTRLEEANAKREEFKKKLPEAKEIDQKAVDELRIPDEEIFNEKDYLEQPGFTKEMFHGLPKNEIEKVNKAQQEARLEVTKAINSKEAKDIARLTDVHTETQLLLEKEAFIDNLDSNEDVKFIEDYLNPEVVMGESVQSNAPIHQINPDSLTPRLRNKFLADPVLKKRKVFSKNGQDIKNVARIFNRKPLDLLKDLSEVPTKKEALESYAESLRESIAQEAKADITSDQSRLALAYNKVAKNRYKELEFMLSNEWSAFKKGIRRVAFDLPKFEVLVNKSKQQIRNTKVKDLNPTIWKVAERKSQRKAMTAILRNKQEEAYREKQNAAYNVLLEKETHLAIAKLNKADKFIAMVTGRKIQNILKEAGPRFQKPIEELFELYTFDRSKKNQIKLDGLIEYAKHQFKEGNGDHRIHPSVLQDLSTVANINELTVDQKLYVADMIRSVVKQAVLKNKLLGKYHRKQEQMSAEIAREIISKHLESNSGYDPNKALVTEVGKSNALQQSYEFIDKANAATTNLQFIILQLDDGVVNGLMSKLIYHALEGIGEHEGPYGRTAKRRWQVQFNKQFKEGIQKYGAKDFKEMGRKRIKVPEFKNYPELRNGNVYKVDLFMMAVHFGNAENKQRLENFGIPIETIETVIKRELQPRDFDFIQERIWNAYKEIAPRLVALEKETKGTDLQLVSPEPFKAHGKLYEGGHFPLMYIEEGALETLVAEMRKRNKLTLFTGEQVYIPDTLHEGIVRSPHTKSRVGSNKIVDLRFETIALGFDQTIHDLTMRVPVRDTMKMVTMKGVGERIASVVGTNKYKVLVNSIAELTKSATVETGKLYRENNAFLKKVVNHVESSIAISYIAYNIKSLVMASLATPEAINVMGATGPRHYRNAVLTLLNPLSHKQGVEFFKVAAEIDPSIIPHFNGLEEFGTQSISRKGLPKKRLFDNKPYHLIKDGQEGLISFAFNGLLGNLDAAQKLVIAMSSVSQFLAGDAPGHPLESIMRLTDEERWRQAKAYATQVSNASLIAAGDMDKAPIQKSELGARITRFWNELRSKKAFTEQTVRSTKKTSKQIIDAVKAGKYSEAHYHLQDNNQRLALMAMMSIISSVLIDVAFELGSDDDDKFKDLTLDNMAEQAPIYLAKKVAQIPNERYLGTTPVVRDALFMMPDFFGSSKNYSRGITVPFLAAVSDSIRGGILLTDVGSKLSDKEFKQLMNASSIFTGGTPTHLLTDIYKDFNRKEPGVIETTGVLAIGGVMEALDYFIDEHDEEKDMPEYLRRRNKKKTGLQQAVDQAKDMRAKLGPSDKDPLNDQGLINVADALSGRDWSHQGPGGGAGIFQFTKKQWNALLDDPKTRKLNLTENGRVSKDQSQQYRAIKYVMKQYASRLASQKIPVNEETLLAAHVFGIEKVKGIYGVSKKRRLKKELLNDARLKDKGVKTSGQLQEYIRGLLNN